MFFVRLSGLLKPPSSALRRPRRYSRAPRCVQLDNSRRSQLVKPEDCKAIIVGGTGAVGLAAASQLLCSHIRQVALIDTDICKGKDAITSLNCSFGKDKALFVRADVTNKKDILKGLELAKDELKTVDLIVNTFAMWNEHRWEEMIATNLVGAITVNEEAEHVLHKPGTVVNLIGVPGIEVFAPAPKYAASFAGMVAYTRSRGQKLASKVHGVRTVVLAVGVTDTKFSRESEDKACCPQMYDELRKLMKDSCWQKSDVVGKAVVEVFKYGQSGTVWVIEGSRLFYVDMPDLKGFRDLASQFL